MGELLNLRRARKARERAAKDQLAEANRLAFGRTKAERQASSAQTDLERARLDAHRLEPLSDAPETPAAPAQDA
jgi:capsule polysaccharide export protein KpsE/RkpR